MSKAFKPGCVVLLVVVLSFCSGCSLIDVAAEGWMVMRHYQGLLERDRKKADERKAELQALNARPKEPDDE